MRVNKFRIFTDSGFFSVTSEWIESSETTMKVRLMKTHMDGRTFVHNAFMGGVLEWLMANTSLGTVYQIRPEDLQTFSDCLNTLAKDALFYFMPV